MVQQMLSNNSIKQTYVLSTTLLSSVTIKTHKKYVVFKITTATKTSVLFRFAFFWDINHRLLQYAVAIYNWEIPSDSEGNAAPPVKTEPYEVNLPYSQPQWMHCGGQLTVARYLTMIAASSLAS